MNLSQGYSPDITQNEHNGKVQNLLVFQLASQSYALAIEHVKQIIPMLKLTPLPQAEHIIAGLANVHGVVVPVINSRRRLEIPEAPFNLYTPIILVQVGKRLFGMIVDEVSSVVTLTADQIAPLEAVLPEGVHREAAYSGVIYQADRVVMLLNPQHLLRPAQVRVINQAIQALPEPAVPADEIFQRLAVVQAAAEAPPKNGKTVHAPVTSEAAAIVSAPAVPEAPAPAAPEAAAEPAAPTAIEEPTPAPEKPAAAKNGRRAARKSTPRGKREKLDQALSNRLSDLGADAPPCDGDEAGSPGKVQ